MLHTSETAESVQNVFAVVKLCIDRRRINMYLNTSPIEVGEGRLSKKKGKKKSRSRIKQKPANITKIFFKKNKSVTRIN